MRNHNFFNGEKRECSHPIWRSGCSSCKVERWKNIAGKTKGEEREIYIRFLCWFCLDMGELHISISGIVIIPLQTKDAKNFIWLVPCLFIHFHYCRRTQQSPRALYLSEIFIDQIFLSKLLNHPKKKKKEKNPQSIFHFSTLMFICPQDFLPENCDQ